MPRTKKQDINKDVYVAHNLLTEVIIAGQQSGEVKQGNPVAVSIFFFSTIAGLCTYKLRYGTEICRAGKRPDKSDIT
jgi:hypothetical protein